MMIRDNLKDTMQPVIRTKDIMEKFHVSRGCALKIMQHESLHAYFIGKSLVVERQYFDDFINNLLDVGGIGTLMPDTHSLKNRLNTEQNAFSFVANVLEEQEGLMCRA